MVPLTISMLEGWLGKIDQLTGDNECADPIINCNIKVEYQLTSAMLPYSETFKDLKWCTKQMSFTDYFKMVHPSQSPMPSTSHEGQNVRREVDIASLGIFQKQQLKYQQPLPWFSEGGQGREVYSNIVHKHPHTAI